MNCTNWCSSYAGGYLFLNINVKQGKLDIYIVKFCCLCYNNKKYSRAKMKNRRKSVLAAMFLAIGLVLPFVTGQIQRIGNMLADAYYVFISGAILGIII